MSFELLTIPCREMFKLAIHNIILHVSNKKIITNVIFNTRVRFFAMSFTEHMHACMYDRQTYRQTDRQTGNFIKIVQAMMFCNYNVTQ